MRGGPHLHTVTRSEGHEGGGGIGEASISLAHPCMAPSLLPAWGVGATWGQMGCWGGGKGKIRQGHQTWREEGGGPDQASPRRAGPRQGGDKGQRQAREDGVGDTWMMAQTEDPMEWGCVHPALHCLPAQQGASACLRPSSLTGPVQPHPLQTLMKAAWAALHAPHSLSSQPSHPVFLAHTPHFSGARAPPLQTCSAHPAAVGRAHS